MGPPTVSRQPTANDALPCGSVRSDDPSPSQLPPSGGIDGTGVKAPGSQGPPEAASADQATSDDFHLMWSELEAYLTKRFSGGPQSLVSLRRVLEQVKRQRLRVEELAFLIGNSFPDAPDVSLCMSLFLPDRTLIHAGNPAAAMCILIQNMAPDKYAIFNSILKSCMAQKTQRGSRDILLHRMQLLFRGHPLVIRAIRKLLVQQFCIEKNGGVIRKNQALELAKPFDDEPVQVHSVFRLAYQVGLSGGCAERARLLASNVLHLVRMFLVLGISLILIFLSIISLAKKQQQQQQQQQHLLPTQQQQLQQQPPRPQKQQQQHHHHHQQQQQEQQQQEQQQKQQQQEHQQKEQQQQQRQQQQQQQQAPGAVWAQRHQQQQQQQQQETQQPSPAALLLFYAD
ncbi:histone deacetylase interacting domain-containing protein, putative [Eimeria brunetti]|uniref:Histone deacetylase interacting domain-containing protein, putative n=1 Tax=Eimeria brunetti TaxID=51314 RepID=U6LMX9_9EIME|nr:histone deacetylase interacting domain-containing protein, putative [Eimeria brunetti]